MYEHIIEIPEIDVRNIAGHYLLNLGIHALANALVGCLPSLIYKVIDARVGVKPAVCTFWREAVGVEGVFKDIRIFIAPNPAQRVELKCAACHVRKKGCGLKSTNIQRNTHIPKLLLQYCRQQTSGFFGRCLHGEMKADAIMGGIPCSIKNLTSGFGIVRISDYVSIVRPALRRQDAERRLRETAPDILQ